jgi:hypothetical protein
MSPRAPVWLLNLDAEHELACAGRYTPSRAMVSLVARQRRHLLGGLVAPGDGVLPDRELTAAEREALAGRRGLAWSPTPGALARLRAAGLAVEPAPALAVLRAVNARPFASRVREPLRGASFEKRLAPDLATALELVDRPAGFGWLARRSFGAAGRGRLRLRSGRPTAAERAWLEASLRLGPLVIEPWVEITREYTRSGWVAAGGEVLVAPPCFQETTAQGAWTRTKAAGAGEVPDEDDRRVAEALEHAGRALARAGYFGPFGIDAFRHRDPARPARSVLNPLSEINARFTMDWTTGMVERAPHRGAGRPSAEA